MNSGTEIFKEKLSMLFSPLKCNPYRAALYRAGEEGIPGFVLDAQNVGGQPLHTFGCRDLHLNGRT